MEKNLAYALFFLLIFPCDLFSQNNPSSVPDIPSPSQNSRFSARHYTTANHLPSGIVQDIAWDSSGFMWISTLKGIARFDGVWMRPFSKNDYQGTAGEYSSPLSVDESGRAIFCDGNANIYGFKNHQPVLLDTTFRVGVLGCNHYALSLPRRFWDPILKHYHEMFLSSNEPILVDSTHFIVAAGKKLLRYDLASNEYTTYETLKTFAHDIKIFKMGAAICLYERGGIISRVEFSKTDGQLSLREIPLSFQLGQPQVYWRNGMEEAILVEKRNAYLLHIPDGRFTRELICDNLPNDIYIVNIKYDARSQTTAVASDGDGIFLYRKKLLTTYIQQSSNILSKPYSFYAQVEIKPGLLWMDQSLDLDLGKDNFRLAPDRPAFQSVYKIKDSLVLFSRVFVGRDIDYSVWSYSLKDRKMTRRFVTDKTESGAFAMTENRLFFANDNGLMEMTGNADSVFYHFNVQWRNTINMARDMIEYRPGYLVFCGEIGVFGFDIHSKKIDTLLRGHGINVFRNVTAYKGFLFLSEYSNGIWLLKDKKARLLAQDKNQYLRSVSNISIDSSGNAWIAANAGIFRINADSLIGQFEMADIDSAYYLKCEYYGKEQGLDVSELNGGRQGSVIKLDNGMLSYTGINGIVTADISHVNSWQGDIIVDRVTVNNRNIPDTSFHSGTEFRPDAVNIKVYFSIPTWTDPGNRITEYRLSGHSDQWEEFDYSRQNYIELKDLPYGKYTLQVRASPSFGGPHADLSFPFEIATPWYRTMPFYILAGLLLLLSVVAIFRWRVYYLKQKNKQLEKLVAKQVEAINQQKIELEEHIYDMEAYQERLEKDYALKNRLISIIGHDIITPLRFMNRAGKVLLTRKDSINQATFDETLKTILDTGTGLQDMAVNMLNWIKHHHETMQFMLSDFDVSQKIDEIIQNIKPMAEFKQLTIVNKIPAGIIVHQYVDPFKTILLQLLTNSIKYSEKGTVVTEAVLDPRGILISVSDEGVGMNPGMITHLIDSNKTGEFTDVHENSGHGFGFLIIKDMLDIMKGQIKIESVVASGTKVSICIPAKIYEDQNL